MRIENRPKHFVSLHVLHSRACFGVPGRADAAAWTHYADRGRRQCRVGSAAQTAMGMATVTSARITLARNQSKIAHFKAAILKLIRKSDLASVGHGLELPAFFPWFLLVPWD